MKTFKYKILDASGRTISGSAELPFEETDAAVRYLERQGDTVLKISEGGSSGAFMSKVQTFLSKVTRKELAEVLNNLSMLLSAGVPVLTGLYDIMADLKNPLMIRTVKFMCTDIENGQTFTEAVSRHPNIFSEPVRNMCRIGEETGRLDEMLKKSSEHLLHLDEIIGSTKRALMYPGFLLFVVVGASVFWFMFVVPQLLSLFKDMGVELPPLTKLVLAISHYFQNYFVLTLALVIALAIAIKVGRKTNYRVRYVTDAIILRIPVVSTISETSMIATVCEYIGILFSAGIGVLQTLDLVQVSVGNVVHKERLERVEEGVRNGNTLSQSMRDARALHPFAIRMISIGEQTGKIDEQTSYVSKIYRDRLAALVEVLGKSLEPMMIIFLGIIFAMILGGLLLPIYDMISQIG